MNAAIILSRLDSRRLPRKALRGFGGKRLVEWCIAGLKKIDLENFLIILATSSRKVDDELQEVAAQNNIHIFRGDAFNVAKRVADCISHFDLKSFARINGDSPFVQPDLIQKGFLRLAENDFVTNLIPRTYPYGVSVEVFNSNLFLAHHKHFDKHQQEHITSFFYENAHQFTFTTMEHLNENLHHVRLTVDVEEDALMFEHMLTRDQAITSKPLPEIANMYTRLSQEIIK